MPKLSAIVVATTLLPAVLLAQSEHIPLPNYDPTGVTFSLTGTPEYFHRHRLEVEGVPEDRQYIYQSNWTGDMGVRAEGLADGHYTVQLDYVDLDLNAPDMRYFDILINGEVVEREVNTFERVGLRRVLSFEFAADAVNGAIEYAHRRTVPEAIFSLFTTMRIYDEAGNFVAEGSAWDLRPPDWDVRGYLDKLYFGPIRETPDSPPWEGTYKIRAHEIDKLTAADVVGPDGIAYPNWRNVGIPGGIPELGNSMTADAFGAIPDDDLDDSEALQAGIDHLENEGGGVLLIGEGTFYLDRPILVTGDSVVIRGEGIDKTRLLSRFSMRGRDPEFFVPDQGPIGPDNFVYLWVEPAAMTRLEVTANGETIRDISRPGLWEKTIDYRIRGNELLELTGSGDVELFAEVTYRDSSTRSGSTTIAMGETAAPGLPPLNLSMINFTGGGVKGDRILLAQDGRRGDMHLTLVEGHGLQAGDRVRLNGPTTDRWNKILRNDHRGGDYRANIYQIKSVDGNRVEIGEPLRIEFPTIDGSYVQRLQPLVDSGIESLTLEQTEQAYLHGVVIAYGWESWAKDIRVVKAGYKPLYMPNCKRCEVRDSEFDRVWYNSGGAGYVGWEHSFDSIMEGVTTYDMRHAPVVQWASSGNVIRKSTFHNSDAQWHAGWTNENLFEELVVESSQDGGSYGNGGWASGPEDTGHGPNGPRNVIYNSNITSSKVGLWMGGMNEAWLIMYNRFIVGRGPAILAKAASFDHIIQGNVFVMMEPYPAAIDLATRDVIGVELVNNRFYGPVDQLVEGPRMPAVDFDNRILKSGNIARPHPPVRSIYDWQHGHSDAESK